MISTHFSTHLKPRINVKKLYCEKKSERSELKSPPQVKIFPTFALQFSTFCNSFKQIQRAFRGGSITFFAINLVHN